MYLIIGVGSHSEIIASILEECNIQFKHVSYDGPVETDLPYAGDIDQIDLQDHEFIVAIGDNHERKNLVREVEEKEPNIKWFNAISPKAHIEKNVTLGVGNTICSGSIIATRSVVGSHCILNTNSSVDHHNTIGSFVHIAPSVSLCGHVTLYDGVFLGVGCSVTPKVKIRPWSFHRANTMISTSSAPIPIYEPYLPNLENSSVITALKSGWVSSQGPYLEKARVILENILKTNVLLVANGTCAAHCLSIALRWKYPQIKKIYVPNSVYVAVWNSMLYEYPSDVLEVVPLDPKTWNLDLDWLIKNAEPNSAVVIVHNVGNIVPIDLIHKARPDLILLEDVCEGIFGKYNGEYAGTSPHTLCSAISFFANKTITSGEGGAVLTQDLELYNHLKKVCNQGNTSKRYVHDVLGYNYRMTNLEAALLFDQISLSSTILEKKAEIFRIYKSKLENHPRVKFYKSLDTEGANWIIPIRLFGNRSFEDVEKYFSSTGIDVRPFFYPIERHQHLKDIKRPDDPVPELLQREIVMFPSGPTLTIREVEEICDKIISYLSR